MAAAVLIALATPTLSLGQDSPLKDSRVGEWARYSTPGTSMQELHSVIARRRQVVVVKVDSIINGKVISSNTENFNINDPNFLRGAEGRPPVDAGGRTFDCVVVRRGNRTLFYSNRVPVTGLVMVVRDGQTAKMVVDFGR